MVFLLSGTLASPALALSASSSTCPIFPFPITVGPNGDNPILSGYCATPRTSQQSLSGIDTTLVIPSQSCPSSGVGSLGLAFGVILILSGAPTPPNTINGIAAGLQLPCGGQGVGSIGSEVVDVSPGDRVQLSISKVSGGFVGRVVDLTTGASISGTQLSSSTVLEAIVALVSFPQPIPQFGSVLVTGVRVGVGSYTVPISAESLSQFVEVSSTSGAPIVEPTMVTGSSFTLVQLGTGP